MTLVTCGAWGWRRRFFREKNLLPRVWKWTLCIVAEDGVLPGDLAEERWKGSSAGSSGRRWRIFFRGMQRKNVVFRESRGRTCGTFFRRLHVLLVEEPAEPSSARYMSFSQKNLRNLLPQATYPSRGRNCETFFVDHVLLYIGFFFLENYVWTTNLLILLVSFLFYFLLQSVYGI